MTTKYTHEGRTFNVGDKLKYTSEEWSDHGDKGHVLEIASIKPNESLVFWCHGISGLKAYDYDELMQVRKTWGDGNFVINKKELKRYVKIDQDWDE